MSLIDRLLDSMKLNDDEDYDYEDDNMYDEDEDYEEPQKGIFRRNKKAAVPDDLEPIPKAKPRTAPNVVPLRAATRGGMEVCMVKPGNIGDAREIVDTLLNGRAVVINMEGIPTEIAQKIIDFTSGACYAVNGNLQKISNFIFIATPPSIELSGDFEDLMGSERSSSGY